MYESFFAFREKPFALTPNPRFLFQSKTHNEVYAHLLYGIENRAGFVEVTGEVGTGKTTVLRSLLSYLDEEKYRVAFIFNPKLTAFELLRTINREFGVADDGLSNADLIQALNEFLLAENRAGRTPILVIDEAQNLSAEVLEQIRLLSNLETEEDKLIQIVLVGQPELRRHLNDHSLRQLNQRIAVRYHLRPLTRDETVAYILRRMHIAGRPDGMVFSRSALQRVFQCSGGVPRRINLICDRALLTAYGEAHGVVSRRNVNQAVAELAGMGEDGASRRLVAWAPALSALVVVLAIVAGFYWLAPPASRLAGGPGVETDIIPAAGGWPSAATLAVPGEMQHAAAEPGPALQPDSLTASGNALFARWNVPLMHGGEGGESFDFADECAARGLEVVGVAGRFPELDTLNLPLLLPIVDAQGGGYLAVLAQGAVDQWTVAPAYQGRNTLSTAELSKIAADTALVPWVDFASIGYVTVPGTKGEHVRRLQFLLGLAGCADIRTNGQFDAHSISCVKAFQRKHGLVVDGAVGPRTLILLYQAVGAYTMPHLS